MDDRLDIGPGVVHRMIASQFPQWAELPVRRAEHDGWDNRTFRLGDELSVRLPSAERYVAQVEKEHRWLPRLEPHLPLPIPESVAVGEPRDGYPWPWSVRRWIDGEPATRQNVADMAEFARSVAVFLLALHAIDSAGGPPAGEHNFHRGGSLGVYDEQTRQAISLLRGKIDTDAATDVWRYALESTWDRPPVWVHGDVSPGNLLVHDGRLHAVIDFGGLAVGDPACDLVIAWTLFEGDSREAFQSAIDLDVGTWARSRGWALWKALIVLAGISKTNAVEAKWSTQVVDEVITDHRRFG